MTCYLPFPAAPRRLTRAIVAGLVLTGCGDPADPKPSADTAQVDDVVGDTTPVTDTTPAPDGASPDAALSDTSAPDATHSDDVVAADTTPDDTAIVPSCDPSARPFGWTDSDAVPGPVHHICAPEHLDAIRTVPTARFVLDSDIDLTGTRWIPIPEFQGLLDGQGHAIIGLSLDCGADAVDGDPLPNCAFVRFVTNGGTLTNLRFAKVMTTIFPNGGTVVGQLKSAWEADLGKPVTEGATLNEVHVSGHVGVIGDTSGGVIRLSRDNALVRNVSFDGTVIRHDNNTTGAAVHVGGIAWRFADYSRVSGVRFRGAVRGPHVNGIAGIVSEIVNQATITGCAVNASISGAQMVAGIANTVSTTGYVENCRVTGDVHADHESRLGGLAGALEQGSFTHSYVSAPVTFGNANQDGRPTIYTVGGGGEPRALLYNTDLTTATAPYADGLPSAELQNETSDYFEDWQAPPWVFVDGHLPTLAFEAQIPGLAQLDTYNCGDAGLSCKRHVEACEEITSDCAPPAYRCVADGGTSTVLGCLQDADDVCACLAPTTGDAGSCDVGDNGAINLSRASTCEAGAE